MGRLRMAFFANRYNIKPMFAGITYMVMILLSALAAIAAVQSRRFGQRTIANTDHNSSFGLTFVMMQSFCVGYLLYFFAFLALLICRLYFFTMFAMTILVHASLAAWRLGVFTVALLAPTIMTIWTTTFAIELGNWVFFLASAATFKYNCFKHNCLPLINGCVRAAYGHIPACSSFHSTFNYIPVKCFLGGKNLWPMK